MNLVRSAATVGGTTLISRLLGFLRDYGPGPEVLPALEAWERAEDLVLVEELPRDAQLEAALGLFEGRRPGAQPLE